MLMRSRIPSFSDEQHSQNPPLPSREPLHSPKLRKSRISRTSSSPIALSNGEPHRPHSSPHIPHITRPRAQSTPTTSAALKDVQFAGSDCGLDSVHVYKRSNEPTNIHCAAGETEPETECSPHFIPQYPDSRPNVYFRTLPVPNPKSRICARVALLPRCVVHKNKHDLSLAQQEISELWSKHANYLPPPSSLGASSSSPHMPHTDPPSAKSEPATPNIYTVEIASNESLTGVCSLLSCRSNVDVVRGFQGSEAQTFVDFLDQVSTLSVPPSLSNSAPFRLLHNPFSMTKYGREV